MIKSPCDDCQKHARCRVSCPLLDRHLEKVFQHGREYLFCEIETETDSGKTFNKYLDTKRDESLLYPVEIETGLDARPMPALTTIEADVLERFNSGLTYRQIARAMSGPGRRFNESKIRNILRMIRKKTKTAETIDG